MIDPGGTAVMKKLPAIRLLLSVTLFAGSAYAIPTVIFSESFGDSAPSSSPYPSVPTYTDYDNGAPIAFSGTADLRSTTPSTGYAGASGASNVFFPSAPVTQFEISGISTLGFQSGSLTLSFGGYKNRIATDMTELTVEYSTDGSSFTPLTFSGLPTGSGTQGWYLVELANSNLLPVTSTLDLRWTNTNDDTIDLSSNYFRLDDVLMTGERASVPESGATVAFFGLGVFGLILFRRFRC